jgi:phosphinothricin acetyltransferase
MDNRIIDKDVIFEKLSDDHRSSVIDIFNFYIENDFSAYPEEKLKYDYYDNFLSISKNYPAFAIKVNDKVVGFCFINSYNPLSSFKETAQITYFIDKDFKGKGIGKMALNRLEVEAKKYGIKNILANIASVNEESLAFHSKNGFVKCGEFENIIKKKDIEFNIIWMQKKLN